MRDRVGARPRASSLPPQNGHSVLRLTPISIAATLVAGPAPSSGIAITGGTASTAGSADRQGPHAGFPLRTPADGTCTLPGGVVLTAGTANACSAKTKASQLNPVFPERPSFDPPATLAADDGLDAAPNHIDTLTFGFTVDDTAAVAISARFLFATHWHRFPCRRGWPCFRSGSGRRRSCDAGRGGTDPDGNRRVDPPEGNGDRGRRLGPRRFRRTS